LKNRCRVDAGFVALVLLENAGDDMPGKLGLVETKVNVWSQAVELVL